MEQITDGETTPSVSRFARIRASKEFIGSAVFGASFTDGFLYGIVVPVLPFSLVDRSGIPHDQVQFWNSLLLVVFGGAMILSCAVLACLTPYLTSRRATLMIGLLSAFAATMLFMLGTATSTLVAGRCLQGLSSGVVYTAGLALVAETVPREEAGLWIGFALSGVDVGILTAPFLAGIVYERIGYFQVFAMGLVVIAIEFVIVLVMQVPGPAGQSYVPSEQSRRHEIVNPEESSDGIPSSTGDNPNDSVPPGETSPLLQKREPSQKPVSALKRHFPIATLLLGSPQVATAVYGCFISYILMTSFDATMPLFVSQTYFWTSSAAGATFLALSIPSVLAPAIGTLSDSYGPRIVAVCGFLITVPGLACMAFMTSNNLGSKVVFCVSLVVVGIGYNFFLIPLAADMSISVEAIETQLDQSHDTGAIFVQAYALLGCALALGTMLGPLISGFLYETTGWGTMCGALASVVLTAMVPVIFFTHGRVTAEEHDDEP